MEHGIRAMKVDDLLRALDKADKANLPASRRAIVREFDRRGVGLAMAAA